MTERRHLGDPVTKDVFQNKEHQSEVVLNTFANVTILETVK